MPGAYVLILRESFDLPCLSSAGLRIVNLNCRSLLSIADEVFDLLLTIIWMFLLLLRHGWTLQLMTEIFPYSVLYVMIKIIMVVGLLFFFHRELAKFVVRPDLCEGHVESIWIELFPRNNRSMLLCCVYCTPSQYSFFDTFLAECELAHL